MRSRLSLLSIAMICLLMGTEIASAQGIFNPYGYQPGVPGMNAPFVAPPPIRPALSPYLNLLRGGSPAANLYLGVYGEEFYRSQQAVPLYYAPQPPRVEPNVGRFEEPRDPNSPFIRDLPRPTVGQSPGFLQTNPYFNLPNQATFVPFTPRSGPGMRR